MEIHLEVLKKLVMVLPWDLAIPLFGIYLMEMKSCQRDSCILIIAALLTLTRKWKKLKCPSTEEQIKKM
jgi:hypothetical protein